MRGYLWYLVRDWMVKLCEHCRLSEEAVYKRLVQWEWAKLLRQAHSRYNVSVVSFNYDMFLEYVLDELEIPYVDRVCELIAWNGEPLHDPTGKISIIKPHGSYHYYTVPIETGRAAPWLTPTELRGIEFRHVNKSPWKNINKVPLVAEIIPPGHAHVDLFNPVLGKYSHADRAFAQCDRLIVAGYSAECPDDSEFQEYIKMSSQCCKAIHVDIGKRYENNAGVIMRDIYRGNYNYVPGDAPDLCDRIMRHL